MRRAEKDQSRADKRRMAANQRPGYHLDEFVPPDDDWQRCAVCKAPLYRVTDWHAEVNRNNRRWTCGPACLNQVADQILPGGDLTTLLEFLRMRAGRAHRRR